jgi:uncharacterized protein
MKNRFREFAVNDKNFIFDGETLRIFTKDNAFDLNKIKSLNYQSNFNNFRSNYLRSICLVLNNSCNLCCNYCYANKGCYDKPNEQMKFEVATRSIDLLFDEIRKNNGKIISVGFFGGEPLLSFKLIKKLVNYVEKNRKSTNSIYKITTNGTLINKQIADFLILNNFDITISIDGDEKKHNFYRKYKNKQGSYKDVKKAIELFGDKKEKITARITITDNNSEIHSYIHNIIFLGIRKITFATDYGISKLGFQKFCLSLSLMIEQYYQDIKKGFFYDITNITRVISAVVFGHRYRSHCNAGISYVTLSADGKYYRCPRFVGKENFCFKKQKNMIISKQEKQDIIKDNENMKRNTRCLNCTYVYLCGGVCRYHAYMSELNKIKGVSTECLQRKILFEKTLQLICKLSVKERRKFLLFLDTLWDSDKSQ